jgi:signal transduction histidine kinase
MIQVNEIYVFASIFSFFISILLVAAIWKIAKLYVSKIKMQKEFQEKMQRAIVEAQEKEREELSNNLHDDFGPQLGIILNQIQPVRNEHDSYTFTREQVEQIAEKVYDLSADIRNYSSLIFPSQIKKLGLLKSIESNFRDLASERLQVDFHSEIEEKIPYALHDELSIFRAVSEAMNNIVNHSCPGKMECMIQIENKKLSISLTHDGSHFSQDEFMEEALKGQGKGCSSMLNRILIVGGVITIEYVFNKLTCINFLIPLPKNDSSN